MLVPGEWAPILFGTLLGAIIGSFIATIIVRWPQGRSVLRGRSACDACGVQLPARDMMPLVSYVARGGKAACCGARIDPVHPFVEAGAMMVGLVSFALFGWHGAPAMLFGMLLLTLAMLDARHFWLPDRLTGLLAVSGLVSPWPGITERLIGIAAGYGTLALIGIGYRRLRGREGLGGGDPKLLGAIGAWTGWAVLPLIMLGAGLAGLALVSIAWLRGAPISGATRVPLGTLLAVVAWPVWLWFQFQP